MKYLFLVVLLLPFNYNSLAQNGHANLYTTQWIHGSANCQPGIDSPIQVVQYDSTTWILRENKCLTFEAPFVFLFIGKKKALLMDTGAEPDENKAPLYKTIRRILTGYENTPGPALELIVAHTHGHGDHTAGDNQFKGKPATTVVGLEPEEVQQFFGLQHWPLQNGLLDLGDRIIEIIPIPGHQKAAIAIYDNKSQLLLTGDSFYPGRLYIRDWNAFELSTQRLVDFVDKHPVTYILGNHIEMKKEAGKDFPVENSFQPNEHVLPLRVTDLLLLNTNLHGLKGKPSKVVLDDFIIYPLTN